jgi:hypothetical protein
MGARSVLFAAALVLSAAGVGAAAGSGSDAIGPQGKSETVVTCSFRDTPLSEALQYFRQTLKLNLLMDPSAEASADKLVTLEAKEMPAGQALRCILRQARLQYVVSEDIVWVADRTAALQLASMSFRQYDVADLIVPFPVMSGGTTAGSTTGGGSSTSGSGGGTSTNNTSSNASTRGRDLLQFLVTFTGRKNWDEVRVIGVSANSGVESQSREDRF